MKPPIHRLASVDASAWTDGVAASDGLAVRDSGPWIEKKHRLLADYAHLFATGMKDIFKNKWLIN